MGLREKHEKLASGHKAAKYQFIFTELELALTFCELALNSKDQARYKRNTANAQRAYDVARHFLRRAGFSDGMRATLERKMSTLRTMLHRLKGRDKKTTHAAAIRRN